MAKVRYTPTRVSEMLEIITQTITICYQGAAFVIPYFLQKSKIAESHLNLRTVENNGKNIVHMYV